MDHRQLTHLLAAIETGQIALAAERAGLTPQAISKSIARLEEMVGGRLLHRTAKGVAPTPLARRLIPHAQMVVSEMQALSRAADAEIGRGAGRLRIGIGPVAANGPLTEALVRFLHRYPAMHIEVVAGVEKDFRTLLAEGQLDIAFASDLHVGAEDTRFILSRPCGRERWIIAGRKDHPLLLKAKALADLGQARWLVGRNTEALDEIIVQDFRAAGLMIPKPSISTTSLPFAHAALRQSDLLAILPESVINRWEGIVGRDFVDGRWQTPLQILRRIASGGDPLIEELENFVTAALVPPG